MDERALLGLVERIAAALERSSPPPATGIDLDAADAFVWEARGERLRPVPNVAGVPFDLLCGIERVAEPAEFPAFGLPLPSASDQMGALLLIARDGYAFTAVASGPVVVDAPAVSLGAHGYVATDPELSALFIASGRNIRKGLTLESMNTIDLGPTAAELLGVELGSVEGRVLKEIFE